MYICITGTVKNNIVPVSVYRFNTRYANINSASENSITM